MAYFGSKATTGLCQPLIAMMPPHDTYIETHLGGGAIMKRKPAALHNIGIDLDGRALATFDCDYPVQRIHGCAHRFLAEYDYRGSELVYSDPPYLMRTRTSGRLLSLRVREADHVELLELLKTLPCQVMLSGYPSRCTTGLLGGWRSLEVQVMNQGGVRTEKLCSTSSRTGCIGPAARAGNFTHRQTIKRKAAGWGERYKAMPRAERLAVLAAMMAVEAEDG